MTTAPQNDAQNSEASGFAASEAALDATSFSAALASAISANGVSLSWLRAQLEQRGTPVSLTTLSYWRSGKRQPESRHSLAAVTEVERLLGLERDDLLRHLGGHSRRIGGVPRHEDDGLTPQLRQLFARMPASPPNHLRMVSLHQTIEVAASGRVSSTSSVVLVQSVAPPWRRTHLLSPLTSQQTLRLS